MQKKNKEYNGPAPKNEKGTDPYSIVRFAEEKRKKTASNTKNYKKEKNIDNQDSTDSCTLSLQ